MISKEKLIDLYKYKRLSVAAIAQSLRCSESKINYWLSKHGIEKRTISDALYLHNNPNGDPFSLKSVLTKEEYFLFGLGIGLYWGEGTKRNKNSIRLGNSDPYLINAFLVYLEKIYDVHRKDCSYSLQVFKGMNVNKELSFWQDFLTIPPGKFYKTMVKEKRGKGTYKSLVEHGVLTVHFNNTKLRNTVVTSLDRLKKIDILTNVL